MSFFTPNNSVERSSSDILEQVQPMGELSCLVASNPSIHMLSRPDEIWVDHSAVSGRVTTAYE
jgi:hypothetical protein